MNAKELKKMIRELDQAVERAQTLDELRDALNAAEKALFDHHAQHPMDDFGEGIEQAFGIDLACLPTFGGEAPTDTMGIFSWDAARVLTADGSRWLIEDRTDDEADE